MTKYKHILVPLDGSELAELALNDALDLAALSDADVTLMRVIPYNDFIPSDISYPHFIEHHKTEQMSISYAYLEEVKQRCPSLEIHEAIKLGDPGDGIIDYASQHDIDLIVMSTHGRSGLSRWMYGSVAQKVLRGADVPVLLVRAHQETNIGNGRMERSTLKTKEFTYAE